MHVNRPAENISWQAMSMAGRPPKSPRPPPGTVGHRFHGAREASGLTVTAAAKRIGIKPSSLTDIERGTTKIPKAPTFAGAARVYGCSAEFLRTGIGTPISIDAATPDESELLTSYRALSAESRKLLLGYARGLLDAAGGRTSTRPFAIRPR